MPEYPAGTPSWIELSSPDTNAAAEFYGALMSWSATEPGPAETGGYRMFQQDEANVAGLMGIMQEGQPTAWSTYASVADAEETAAKVKVAGGSVVVEPMDVMDIGRMAIFADPTGAVFGVWQPRSFAGADLVNEPNSLCWNEALTRDANANKAFYPAVFGWVAGRPSFEGAPETYTVWELAGKPVGGMMQMTDEYSPGSRHTGACASRSLTVTPPSPRPARARGDDDQPADGHAHRRFAGIIICRPLMVMQPAGGWRFLRMATSAEPRDRAPWSKSRTRQKSPAQTDRHEEWNWVEDHFRADPFPRIHSRTRKLNRTGTRGRTIPSGY